MTYVDEIDHLIGAQDVKRVIERVADPPFQSVKTADREVVDAYEKAKEFLYDRVEEVVGYLSGQDARQRYRIVRALGELRHRDSIEPLFQQLINDKDEDVADLVMQVLAQPSDEDDEESPLWVESGGYEKYLLDAVRKTKGRRLPYFYEIATGIQSKDIRYRIFRLFGTRPCNIRGGICDEDLVVHPQTYFIGYDFKKWRVKEAIVSFFKNLYPDFRPILPEKNYLNRTLLCHICRLIQTTQFCIFDLSSNRHSNFPNSNVMLELGMALVLGRQSIILRRQGTQIISDLQGPLYVEYRRPSEIPKVLISKDLSDIVG